MTQYATTSQGDTFVTANMLREEPWNNASNVKQDKALNMATILIDQLNFSGSKTEDDQDQEFPRGEDTTVPIDIQNACILIAYALVEGKDPELEREALRRVQVSYGPVRTKVNSQHLPEHTLHGIPSNLAWAYLKPYLRDQGEVTLYRVS